MLSTVVGVRMDSVMGGGALGSGLWGVRLVLVLPLWFGVLRGGFGGGGGSLFSFGYSGFKIGIYTPDCFALRVVLNIALDILSFIKYVPCYISVEAGSSPINTLYNRLLTAGPILESVRAPFLFADFYIISPIHSSASKGQRGENKP